MCKDESDRGCCGHEEGWGKGHHGGGYCGCGGNLHRPFIFPAVLLLLSEEPGHGYSLSRKLIELGLLEDETNLAPIYRVLTRLEDEGLAEHEHVGKGQGPARKVYHLTESGTEALASWSDRLAWIKELIDWFDAEYARQTGK